MVDKFRLKVILYLVLIGTARAEIPLTVVQTIQLPQGTEEASLRKWDVQHWINDSTWGWAALVDSHLVFARQLSDASESILIPSTLFPSIEHNFSYSHRAVRLFRYPDSDSTLGIALLTDVQWYHYYDACGDYLPQARMDLSLFNATDGARTSVFSWEGSYMTAGDVAVTREVQINQMICVPVLPLGTSDILVTLTINEVVGEHTPVRYTTSHFGQLRNYHFANNTEVVFNDPPCDFVEPFVRTGPASAVGCGRAYSYVVGPHGDSYLYYDFTALNHFRFTDSGLVWDSLNFVRALAQSDSDGTGHILGIRWDGTTALSESGFDTLWQNPAIVGTVFTAHLFDSPDERVLNYNGSIHKFAVFNASDGRFLDSTGALAGDFQYLIKRPGFESEFVAFQRTTRTVFIHKSAANVRNLTCTYQPETNRIRLHWSSLPGATRYRVYMAPAVADSPYQGLCELPPDVLSYEFLPEPQMRFFYVTADVGER